MFEFNDRQNDCPNCGLPGLGLHASGLSFAVECRMCGWTSEGGTRIAPVNRAEETHGLADLEAVVSKHSSAKRRGPLHFVLRAFL
jgi:hypothetical protein